MNQHVKTLMLPLAMLAGLLLSGFFAALDPLTPYLIFAMLFITFCRISPSDIRFSPLLLRLLSVQVGGGVVLFLLLSLFDVVAAQGIAICVFAPTAVSAVVVGGMLGANIATMASFSLLSNITVALLAPILFSLAGSHAEMPFWNSFLLIFSRVGPLLILPFIAAFSLARLLPRVHAAIARRQTVSFYLWAFSLMIVTGRTVEFIAGQPDPNYALEILIAAGSLAVCLLQFALGRRIGARYGEKTTGGQSLGQKNTVLAIWMAQTYLDPVSSIGPSAYVLWQNLINSLQLWRSKNK